MLEMVKERLKSFGYELQEGDEFALTFSIQKVENTIKNDCNTPSIPDGLVNIAVDMDIPALEETLNRSDLYVADEMFMTGSAAELTPIGSVDNRVIGKPGPITKALQERYFDVAYGKVPEYEEWITRIAE